MKQEILPVSVALEQGKNLPFAWVRTLSAVTLGRTPVDILEKELVDARFFDEQHEIRVFRQDNDLRAVQLIREKGDMAYTETFSLVNPDVFGASVTVCHELDADEDGQAFIASTRLIHWEGDEKHG